MNEPLTFNCLRVVSSPLAVKRHVAFDVVRLPRRRRRAYSVLRRQWDEPACYVMAGGVFVAHPEIVARLMAGGGLR